MEGIPAAAFIAGIIIGCVAVGGLVDVAHPSNRIDPPEAGGSICNDAAPACANEAPACDDDAPALNNSLPRSESTGVETAPVGSDIRRFLRSAFEKPLRRPANPEG